MISCSLGFKKNLQNYTTICPSTQTITRNVSVHERFKCILGILKDKLIAKHPQEPSVIRHDIYLGGCDSENIWDNVVCLQEKHETNHTKSCGNVLNIPVPDYSGPNFHQLYTAVEFIHKHKDSKVLVHCKSGKGRSPIVIIAYLCKYENKTINEAFTYVRQRRNISSIYDLRGNLKYKCRLLYLFTA